MKHKLLIASLMILYIFASFPPAQAGSNLSGVWESKVLWVKSVAHVKHEGEKVFLHCQANMRASAFMFLYRVTQLGEDKMQARILMDSIWYPTNTWHRFIAEGLLEYGFDPEYRFEPEFVRMVREKGASSVHKELQDGSLDIAEFELKMIDNGRGAY